MSVLNKFNMAIVLFVLATLVVLMNWRAVTPLENKAVAIARKLPSEFRSEFNTHAPDSVYWRDFVRYVPESCLDAANVTRNDALDRVQPRLSVLPGFFEYIGLSDRPRVLVVESTTCKIHAMGSSLVYGELDRVRFQALQKCTAQSISNGIAHPYCVVAILESTWQADMQRPMIAYPGLYAQMVWHDGPMQFAEALALEANFADIDAEFDKLVEMGLLRIHPEELVEKEGDWRVFTLWSAGKEHVENTKLAPKTAAVWRSMNAILPRTSRMVFGLVYFSVLVPGANVLPHFGSTNMRIRHHIGIRVPTSGTVIKLVELPLEWRRAHVISFDDSYAHSVINNATTARAVLIADIWHPELRPEEIDAIVRNYYNQLPTRVPKDLKGDQTNQLNYAAKD